MFMEHPGHLLRAQTQGQTLNKTYVPVLGVFAVQGVSQASDTGADEAIQWQVTVTDAGRK